ncbi:hypothetical protein GFB57_18055 [Citrobacter sp. S39]|uniref:hypothetical protein n=1 Tax=Citrobacter TaxID=544 RepID=UPI0012A93DC5|nr:MULTISPECIES: hypothetical protein [Citrobacter]MDX7507802.1 hypothetical protein [Citrobacter freundii]QFX90389.1 hypothetical protein GFB57_18055 [Citrobacter sp. S39]
MINKRGLSPQEFEDLDPDLFEALLIYDQFIEPSGAKMDMLFYTHLCHTMTINTPGMTKEIARKIKSKDFDFLGILDDRETRKERIERITKDRQTAELNKIGDAIKAQVAQMKGKGNGKK